MVLGPLKVGAESIARLLVTIVGALADLLVPKSLVRSGVDGIRWLVSLPPVGTEVDPAGMAVGVRMPHLHELREVLTWIGVTLLPLGLIVSAARAYLLAPTTDVAPDRARLAARVALDDQGVDARVRLKCLPSDACRQPGSRVRVVVRTTVPLPFTPSALGAQLGGIVVDSSHVESFGAFRAADE